MNVATAPRERRKINMRKMLAYAYYGTGKALRSLTGDDKRVIRQVIYYPMVKDTATLADLVNRISWYLPHSNFSKVEVSVLVDETLLNTDIKSLVPPAPQQSYIGQCENIHLIGRRDLKLSKADTIMLWDKGSMFAPNILWHLGKVTMVDPDFYYVVESVLAARLYFQILDSEQKERFLHLSKKNFQSLLNDVGGCKKGYVFGTGPSLERAKEFDFRGGFSVVCNSIVKNKDLLKYIRPQLLVFVDEAFFFSPCRYSAEFRQMMLEAVNEFQCYIMVRDHEVPLLLAHHPQLENRVIGMSAPSVWDMSVRESIGMLLRGPSKMPLPGKVPGHQGKWNFPTLDKFYVHVAPSVMPGMMVPVVSSVCQEIYIIGADGRKPDENYFWTHSSASQLGDLMRTIFDTHPSFFRDTLYADEYVEYCDYFKELVQYGESLGKKYYSLTPSYIPVLAQRPAPGREQ